MAEPTSTLFSPKLQRPARKHHSPIIESARLLYEGGMSMGTVARQLGVPSGTARGWPPMHGWKRRPIVPLPGEEWRPVVGREKTHIVSNMGRACRVKTNHGTEVWELLTLSMDDKGYYRVSMFAGEDYRRRENQPRVHQLVARAFIGPTPDGMEINHIDTVKTNNCPDNFEFVTHQQNTQHAIANGCRRHVRGERQHSAKLTESDVRDVRGSLAAGESVRSVSKRKGVGYTAITNIRDGITWRHVA